MSRPVSPRSNDDELKPEAVADYLRAHPDFFEDHLELLETLAVPHPSGSAVSLVARQIDLLREKNRRLLKQMDELVQIARENDGLHQRIHQLTLTLVDACSVEDILAGLAWGLHQYFQADYGVMRLIEPERPCAVSNLFIPSSSPFRAWAETIIENANPTCGSPDSEYAGFLFGDAARNVASHALIGLKHAGLRGVFAIGSQDAKRFRSDMGSEFLRQMSDILAARLAALLDVHA